MLRPVLDPETKPIGVSQFQRFFREAAGLDVDKDDLKRYNEFVDDKLFDLLLLGQATAIANGRDVMEPWDLPITKGLQESIHAFRRLGEANAVEPLLEQIAIRPQMDVALADETVERFPEILGGISVALAKTFRILDPESRSPHTDDWERAFRIFDTLL